MKCVCSPGIQPLLASAPPLLPVSVAHTCQFVFWFLHVFSVRVERVFTFVCAEFVRCVSCLPLLSVPRSSRAHLHTALLLLDRARPCKHIEASKSMR